MLTDRELEKVRWSVELVWLLDDDLVRENGNRNRQPNHHLSSSYSKLRSPFVPIQCSMGACSGMFRAS